MGKITYFYLDDSHLSSLRDAFLFFSLHKIIINTCINILAKKVKKNQYTRIVHGNIR